ncbi:MAG: hypothetical protein GX214_03290 [Clostridiales bacterium]|nr:hypothetical protein [Clostridiales bacterium]
MKSRKKIMQVILIFIIIFNATTLPIPYREKFDKTMAEEMLKNAYKPLEDFISNGIPVEDEGLFLAPDNIETKEDFVKLFNNKINTRLVENFFEDLIIEKDGRLYIDRKVYIPTIYVGDGVLTKSYIKKYTRSLYSYILDRDDRPEEKLVIKEKWKITGEWFRRSNYFIKNDEGEWVLDYFNGSSMHKFVEVDHNPWNYN